MSSALIEQAERRIDSCQASKSNLEEALLREEVVAAANGEQADKWRIAYEKESKRGRKRNGWMTALCIALAFFAVSR